MDRDAERILAHLYEEQYGSILRKCMSIIDRKPQHLPMVEDCIQEAFVKAIECYDEIKDYENPAGWIVIVAINHINNELAKERRHARIAPAIDPEKLERIADPEGIDSILNRLDIREKLYMLYEAESPEDQRIFDAYFCENKSASEISKDTGKTEDSIRSRIKRIKKKAREKWNNPFLIIRFILLYSESLQYASL